MFERPPNGFFVRDLILFNHLRRGGYVAKGFVFEAPDLTNSPVADLNDFQDQLCLLLASLHENQRLQVQYFSDSDYKSELLRFQAETGRFDNVWTKRSRNERFARYWQAMIERKLRRQRVVIYVSRLLDNVPPTFTSNAALREYYLKLLDQQEMEFSHVHQSLMEIFASAGTRVLPMSDLDHFKHYKSFLNPSLADRFDFDPANDFQPELSIQENCWHSEGNGQSDFGFYLDGHYHSVIALTRWPRTTYPGIIQLLTNLRLLDYSITVNVDPLPITQEISKEEKEHDRVAGDYASEKENFAADRHGEETEKNPCAHAGSDHSVQGAVCHPGLGQIQGRAECENRRHQERHQRDELRAVFREQPAQHFQKSVLPDVAGLDMGTLRTSQAVFRTSLSRRHAARHQHVHRPSGNRRGHLRRPQQ